MAHVWLLNDSDEWAPHPLRGDECVIGAGLRHGPGGAPADVDAAARALLRRLPDPPNTWAVVSAAPGLRLNGGPLPLGIALLEDRDEIRLPALTAWFSTEALARIEPFPESGSRGFCPRCKQAIASASLAVRCPGCGLWHHASEDLPCWTYAATCAACAQETALDGGFRWTPEAL